MADVLLSLFEVADEGANGEMIRNKHTRDDPSVCRLLILSMEDPSDKRGIITEGGEYANLGESEPSSAVYFSFQTPITS